jgi:hypothetical protein
LHGVQLLLYARLLLRQYQNNFAVGDHVEAVVGSSVVLASSQPLVVWLLMCDCAAM